MIHHQQFELQGHSLTSRSLDLRSVITLTVDDCWKTHAQAFNQSFDSKSLRGVLYVIAVFVGREISGFQFIEWDALRQMSKEGQEIGSHVFTLRGSDIGLTTNAIQFIR